MRMDPSSLFAGKLVDEVGRDSRSVSLAGVRLLARRTQPPKRNKRRRPKPSRSRLTNCGRRCRAGDIKKMRAIVAKARKIDPQSSAACVCQGIVALVQKDYAAAEERFEVAHLQEPDDFAASNNLALALCEQKDKAKQRRALEYANTTSSATRTTRPPFPRSPGCFTRPADWTTRLKPSSNRVNLGTMKCPRIPPITRCGFGSIKIERAVRRSCLRQRSKASISSPCGQRPKPS